MGMINGLRVLNAISSGTMTGAQLETYLATSTNLGSFRQLLQLRGQTQVVAASSTAMTAVAASSTAMTAVSASSTAMTAVSASSTATNAISGNATANNSVLGGNFSVGAYLDRIRIIAGATTDTTLAAQATMAAVIASSTALNAVTASSTAMTAVIASSTALNAVTASSTAMTSIWASNTAADSVMTSATARLAVYNADLALSALQANPTQVQRQIDTAGRTTTASTASIGVTYVALGTKVLLLRAFLSGNEDMSLQWGRGLTSDDVAGGLRLPNGENLGAQTAAIGRTTTYANSGTLPQSNNANSNVVSAGNGLRRRTNSITGGLSQTVIYIVV